MLIHKTTIRNYSFTSFLILCVFLLLGYSLVGASPNNDLQSILDNTPYYNPTATSCGLSGNVTIPNISPTAATSGTWTSSVTSPYYLEEFAINVLEDVAQKTGVNPTGVVTQEHVIALIAWFYREGGDIADGPPLNGNSPNLFNPLNTSIQDPSLESTTAGGGIESFKSFNAGVEGTARTIVGSYQNRIAGVLTEQYSTAEQVAQTIADFQDYPGNLAWASPPGNPTLAEVIADNQNNYLPSLLQVIEQVRSQYVSSATLELGTPMAEIDVPADHVNSSLLMYQSTVSSQTGISTSSSTTSSNTGCNGNVSCNSSSPTTASSSQLSQIRQNVVCIATNELKEHWLPITPTTQYSYYKTYTQGATEQWCADFVSWVYNQAGYPFAGGGGWRFPGVIDIYNLGELNQKFHWHSSTSGYVPQPGDLAIHYDPTLTNPYYHVNLVVAVNTATQTVTYIGGDQPNPIAPVTYYGTSNSNSVVSSGPGVGYYNNGDIKGYVSPD